MVRSNVEKVFPEQARKHNLTRVWILVGLLVVLAFIAWEKEVIYTLGIWERAEKSCPPPTAAEQD